MSNILLLFSKVLEDLGYHVPENELITFINQLDTDKSGENKPFVNIKSMSLL